jgi:hypothetical protein
MLALRKGSCCTGLSTVPTLLHNIECAFWELRLLIRSDRPQLLQSTVRGTSKVNHDSCEQLTSAGSYQLALTAISALDGLYK